MLGAHVSASGGASKAVANAQALLGPQAQSFAFFIRPRLTWRPVPPLTEAAIRDFHAALETSQFSIANVVVHGSYLINLGSHDADLRSKSIELMVEEVKKCEQLGIALYVFHPGASTGHAEPKATKRKRKDDTKSSVKKKRGPKTRVDTEDDAVMVEAEDHARAQSIQYVGQCVADVLNRTTSVTLVLENSCGHGNTLCRDFDELRALLDASVTVSPAEPSRLGVCLDTCHAFASGYTMDSFEACDTMMKAFDEAMGPAWLARNVLKVIHVNDSKDVVGSRRDRHSNIGRGTIGLAAFQWLMTTERFTHLPMILETPRSDKKAKTSNSGAEEEKENDLPTAQEEIALLRSFYEASPTC